MIDVSADEGWLAVVLQIINLIQMVVQGRWHHDSPLLCLPHMDHELLKYFVIKSKMRSVHCFITRSRKVCQFFNSIKSQLGMTIYLSFMLDFFCHLKMWLYINFSYFRSSSERIIESIPELFTVCNKGSAPLHHMLDHVLSKRDIDEVRPLSHGGLLWMICSSFTSYNLYFPVWCFL